MTNRVVNVPISYSDLHLACTVLFRAMVNSQVKAKLTESTADNPADPCADYCAKTLALDEKEARDAKLAYEAISNALVDASLLIRPDGYIFAEEFQM